MLLAFMQTQSASQDMSAYILVTQMGIQYLGIGAMLYPLSSGQGLTLSASHCPWEDKNVSGIVQNRFMNSPGKVDEKRLNSCTTKSHFWIWDGLPSVWDN